MFSVGFWNSQNDFGQYNLTAKTLLGAKRQALKLVHSVVPAWQYKGYGPTVAIFESGREVYRKKM